MEQLQQFCDTTTLHGWSRLTAKPTSLPRIIFWVLLIITSVILSGVLIFDSIEEYLNSDVATNLVTHTGSLSEAAFPKILICNVYKLRQSFIDGIFNSTGALTFPEMIKLKKLFKKEFLTGYTTEEMKELNISHLYDTIDVTLLTDLINTECSYHTRCNITQDLYDLRNDDKFPLLLTAQQSFYSMVAKLSVNGQLSSHDPQTIRQSFSLAAIRYQS